MSTDKIILIVFAIVIIILLVYYLVTYVRIDDVSNFTSSDGSEYAIRNQGTSNDQQYAADYLASLNNKVTSIVTYMYNNKLPNQAISSRLYNRWSNCNLRETATSDNSVAFTVNKGHEIRICIRSGPGSFEDPNTAMFVILHELAHIMSVTYGHNDEFNNNFSYITHLASNMGLYTPENFHLKPKNYCGVSINTTPCSDGTCTIGS